MINEGFPSTSAAADGASNWQLLGRIVRHSRRIAAPHLVSELGPLSRLAPGLLKADIGYKSDQLACIIAGANAQVQSPSIAAVAVRDWRARGGGGS